MKIIAKRDDGVLLVQLDEHNGFLYYPIEKGKSPVMDIYSFLARGQWDAVTPTKFKED